MAAIFVKLGDPKHDSRPMVCITIEPESNAKDDAYFGWKTRHGFCFVLRTEDAVEMAASIQRLAGCPLPRQ